MRNCELILIALVALLIIIFLLCKPTNASDYKSCVIKYKTGAGLCWQIEKILNTVDTTMQIDTVRYRMTYGGTRVTLKQVERWLEGEKRMSGYVESLILPNIAYVWTAEERMYIYSRQYRGLEVMSVPKFSPAIIDKYLEFCPVEDRPFIVDSLIWGKAILIWEEVEK